MSLYIGDVRDGLRSFIAAWVRAQTCVTSPPYWGLRDYGVAGQLGLEPTIAEYVANMVEVFRLVRDVLADDGTLWLNLGDSYTSGGRTSYDPAMVSASSGLRNAASTVGRNRPDLPEGLKPKDLCGIPWRVAFALQADGWWLRQDIIWAKPNPMPESVTDRCTKSHEYLFLLAKSERYYYDAAAIAEPASGRSCGNRSYKYDGVPGMETKQGVLAVADVEWQERNRRSVWTVTTQPYAEAHFATFPTALVEPCIMAGTSDKGHCPACGKGWERVIERIGGPPRGDHRKNHEVDNCKTAHPTGTVAGSALSDIYAKYGYAENRTTGWAPTCACGREPVPGVVLDPFMGSGTVAQVAQDLGRRWIGCELNPEYAKLICRRTAQQGLALEAAD